MIVIAPAYLGLRDHEIDGVTVRRFRYAPARWETLTHGEGATNKLKKNPILKLLTLGYLVSGAHAVWKICRRERIEILHVHWPFPHGLMALLPSWWPGCKIVSTCHSAELALAAGSKVSTRLLAFCLRRSAAITANSAHTAKLIRDVSQCGSQIIPWGATVKVDQSERQERPVTNRQSQITACASPPPTRSPSWVTSHLSPLTAHSTKEALLLFSGRLIERKGVNFLLRAMPLILKERQVRLVITGDGHCRQEWEELTRRLGLNGNVRFAGFVSNEELGSLFRSCSIYVHPAIYDSRGDTEGQGVVLVEALANTKPVVASAVGGIVDLIKDGETGLLVPEKNPEAIAHAVLRLLKDPGLGQRLGQQGYAYAREYYDWDRIMAQYDVIYRRCVPSEDSPTVEGVQRATTLGLN